MLKRSEKTVGVYDKNSLAEEYEGILSEQKKCIDTLKEQKYLLEERLSRLEADRHCVTDILYQTQQNADLIIQEASEQAERIIKSAQIRADDLDECVKKMNSVEAVIVRILNAVRGKENKRLRCTAEEEKAVL